MRQATRIVIMIGNLFVCSLAISANWYPVQEDDEKTIYIETGKMKRQGDKITYWEYWAFKKPQEWEGKQYSARMSYHTTNCKERMTGATKAVVYDKEDNVVFSYDYPLDMKSVIPNSMGEILLDKACALKEKMKQ